MVQFETCKYIVCSAGGTDGIMFFGFMKALLQNKHFKDCVENAHGFAGTSMGAIISLVLILNLEYEVLHDILRPYFENVSNVAPNMDLSRLLKEYGLDDGRTIKQIIGTIIRTGGLSEDNTLSDFKRLLRKTFVCCTTELESRKSVYLSAESHPSMKVVDAVFMSLCVPFLFTPVEYNDRLYVDGAMTSYLPDCFDANQTLFVLVGANRNACRSIRTWNDYIQAVFACGLVNQFDKMETYLRDGQVLHLKIPTSLLSNAGINLHMHHFVVRQYLSYGYACGLQVTYPQFNEAIESCLRCAIVGLTKVLHHMIDEHYMTGY